jgi:hypothetical protein
LGGRTAVKIDAHAIATLIFSQEVMKLNGFVISSAILSK